MEEVVKVELFIPGELKEEPIICDIIKNYDITLKIVEASFSTESGWAYLVLTGEKNVIDRVFTQLIDKGVSIEIKKD
ncbi:MAG: NIL domain-containing protein [Candidatus Omnitrophica bacterium]|nr:NIL domain-containing protein [Candidatus Omnitrophota bacterium]MDD4013628.1 NIL domain-containing protein [Candidatus Omnitrophota bacterium]